MNVVGYIMQFSPKLLYTIYPIILALIDLTNSELANRTQNCGDVEMKERDGRIYVDKSTRKRCKRNIYHYYLNNENNLLYVNIDITESKYNTPICNQALDFVLTPDNVRYCRKDEKTCRIFYNKDTNVSSVPPFTKSKVAGKCNTTWIAIDNWPPTFEIQDFFGDFKTEIHYQFVSAKNKTSRSIKEWTGYVEKEGNEQSTPQLLMAVALSIVGVAALAFIVGLLWYKKQQQVTRNDMDITPYAIHVSVRSRSESNAAAFNLSPIENLYDEPTTDGQENEYLHPINESPYYEIDNDAVGIIRGHDCDVYNGPTDSIGLREEANCSLFSTSENVYYNSEAMTSHDVPTCSQSLDNLNTRNKFVNVSYGEIIGTLSQDGSLERFEPCIETYKSVRKNRPKVNPKHQPIKLADNTDIA